MLLLHMLSLEITWEVGKYVKLNHITTWNVPKQKSEETSGVGKTSASNKAVVLKVLGCCFKYMSLIGILL